MARPLRIPRRRANRRLFAAAGCLALLVSTIAPAQSLFVGGNPGYVEKQVVVGGLPATVVQMTAYFHQMDLPPHSVQPIGLEEFFFVLKGNNRWLSDHCEKWIRKVEDDERAWTATDPTYPYLIIAIDPKAKPITVDDMTVYRDTDVQCWEGMDFGRPLY